MNKMKKSFFLIEVLISIVLISGVIFSLFQIKSNNLHFLEKYASTQESNAVMLLVALNNKETSTKNENIYLNDVVDFKDDEIRKQLKDFKVSIKEELLNNEELLIEGLTIKVETTEINYSIDKQLNKQIHVLKFN